MSIGFDSIRVFIGTEPKTEIARKVLELSITRRTEANVGFTPMIGRAWEYPKDLPVGTGFSLRRWMIPAFCQWRGLAVYMDADQLVLGDINELVALTRLQDPACPEPVIWCTHQPDKFSPARPVPQTSVMVIDCARAQAHWGFHLAKIIAHLRANPTKDAYGAFMHADWLAGRIAGLPVEWNHLNVYEDGVRVDLATGKKAQATRLLHYTKEPEQPWYRPDHPLAGLWQRELTAALNNRKVTYAEVEAALARWDVKEDWRPTNGLHPHYRRFLVANGKVKADPAPAAPPAPRKYTPPEAIDEGTSKVLWATSFDPAIFEASGRQLVESFLRTGTAGTLLCCTEGKIEGPQLDSPSILRYDLGQDAFLRQWLRQNAGVIPRHLGGLHDGKCRCRGGPYGVHDKKHRQPCLAYWFNRNASRWFRKVASLRRARDLAVAEGHDLIVWVDADCVFTARVTVRVAEGWFRIHTARHAQLQLTAGKAPTGVGVFYHKSKRAVLESGVIGFNLHPHAHGGAILDAVFEHYSTGRFRQDERWDDCFQFQRAISRAKHTTCVDLATAVGKEHADVVPHSPVGPFITHRKGLHSRGLGIMT